MKTMKLFLLTLSLFSFANSTYANKINALKPERLNAAKVIFADNSQAELFIVLAKEATSKEIQSATFLQTYLNTITKGDFSIIKEPRISSKTFISIGITATLKKDIPDWQNTIASLGTEGYALDIKNGNIYLYSATARGLKFAVLALLEEDLGCRWYNYKWTYIPSDNDLRVDISSRVDKPQFKIRDPFSWVSNVSIWAEHNRVHCVNPLQNLKGHSAYLKGWWCHSYNSIYPWRKFKERPDLFMINESGKRMLTHLCPTNPDVVSLAENRIKASLANNYHDGVDFVSISQGDHSIYCHCKRCQAINLAENAPVAAHLTLVNHIAKLLRASYPDLLVTFLAYHHTQKLPLTMNLEDNVVVRLCTTFDDDVNGAGAKEHLKPITEYPIFMKRLKEWNQRAKALSIWDYQVDFRNYLRPWPTMYAISKNIKCFAEYKVIAIMIQGAYQCSGGERQGMRAWVFSKLLWNPELDINKLMKDYICGVYAKSAPAMLKYNNLIFNAGKSGKTVEEYYGAKNFIAKAKKIFLEAEQLSACDERILKRIQLAQLPIIDMELHLFENSHENSNFKVVVEDYEILLNKFKAIAARNRIAEYAEGKSIRKVISERKIFLNNLNSSSTIPGTVWADDTGLRILKHLGAELVKDPLAGNGYAVRQSTANINDWSLQWDIPYTKFDHVKKYQLYVSSRIDKTKNKGIALTVGIYNRDIRNNIFKRIIKVSEISKFHYQRFKIGLPCNLPNNCYVWIAPNNNKENVQAIYTDRFDFVPE